MNSTPSSEKSVYFDAPMSATTPTTEAAPAIVESPVADAPLHVPATTPLAEAPPIEAPAALTEPPTAAAPAVSTPPATAEPPKTSPTSSALSPNGHGRAASLGYAPSVSKRSVFTNNDGETIGGSTFINGAGTTGPNATAERNESLHQRAASADAALSEQQKARIAKNGAKGNKQLAKIIQTEAKVEKKALNVAVKELGELQKIQKTAVKREAKAQAAYTKTLTKFQKYEAAFLAARAKFEASQSTLTSHTETLEISRNNAKEATASMQDKSQEVDGLRTMFDVDEKEREVKMVELTGKPTTTSRWRFQVHHASTFII
ncbi:hypothetical protein B0H17DRAFT_1192033 [Mycena rosella]|uniref:DNA binding protein Ncp1 n=1 Tax=Mycena rosella TaxID=1033263 RepID=A0AAD7GY07_MYCRO|nr:hypothetical protein B0H17DRAFT_1192033 [Mycena rosella]